MKVKDIKKLQESYGAKVIEVDEEVLVNAIWDRLENTEYGKYYTEDFWKEAIDTLAGRGWLIPSFLNKPDYIVDNLAVNAEILEPADYLVDVEEYDPDDVADMDDDEIDATVSNICQEKDIDYIAGYVIFI